MNRSSMGKQVAKPPMEKKPMGKKPKKMMKGGKVC